MARALLRNEVPQSRLEAKLLGAGARGEQRPLYCYMRAWDCESFVGLDTERETCVESGLDESAMQRDSFL
jgi:hypothetical protein